MTKRNARPGRGRPESPPAQLDSTNAPDKVDEAVRESFPASDPPPHTGTQARPAANDAAAEARLREEMKNARRQDA